MGSRLRRAYVGLSNPGPVKQGTRGWDFLGVCLNSGPTHGEWIDKAFVQFLGVQGMLRLPAKGIQGGASVLSCRQQKSYLQEIGLLSFMFGGQREAGVGAHRRCSRNP